MKRLLLVDDDALIRLLVMSVLDSVGGWVVREAESLEQAGELLRAEPVPDVVVLDERLPDGSGLDLVSQIRALPVRVHVVLYSGATFAEVPADVDAVVQKGGQPGLLLDHLMAL